MKGTVRVIPATRDVNTHKSLDKKQKKRVAAYVRVSTIKDRQFNSFKNQIDYFQQFIDSHKDWVLVDIYHDEGVTGTSTKGREGFCRMLDDAFAGKIDLIITKSLTRFARNTIDAINSIRKLKAAGIEVYFENDNIWTLSEEGEFIITLISALAQEESRSISENTKWGMRKAMKQGKGCVTFSRFLGYERGPNGEYVIDEKQAAIVKGVYEKFVYGYTLLDIAKMLEESGVKTVTGKSKWHTSTIRSILTNEKYKGDCLLQKYYVEDHITHITKQNKGELPQYYIKNHHDAIVTEEQWDMVQEKLIRHRKYSHTRVREGFFRGIMHCMACNKKCNGLFTPTVVHRNDKYRGIHYRCNFRYSLKCSAPIIKEKELILAVFDAVTEEIVLSLKDKIYEVRNTGKLIAKYDEIKSLSSVLIYEILDEISVLSKDELLLVFYSGKERHIDLATYHSDYRKPVAYRFITGTEKEKF